MRKTRATDMKALKGWGLYVNGGTYASVAYALDVSTARAQQLLFRAWRLMRPRVRKFQGPPFDRWVPCRMAELREMLIAERERVQ